MKIKQTKQSLKIKKAKLKKKHAKAQRSKSSPIKKAKFKRNRKPNHDDTSSQTLPVTEQLQSNTDKGRAKKMNANGSQNRVKSGRVEKTKLKKNRKQNMGNSNSQAAEQLNKKTSKVKTTENATPSIKPKKKQITHQLLFCRKLKKKKQPNVSNDAENDSETNKPSEPSLFKNLSRKEKSSLPLHERMMEKLMSARFRYLNEQMYTNKGYAAKEFFDSDPSAYTAYHEGYRQQVARWPINPLDVIIKKIKKLPRFFTVADFGCGEAKLAQSVPHKVHSFDLVAINDSVSACDMANVPLENNSINVVVFCLSLMGTNLKDYLVEANRVLMNGGLLKIAEVESRFDDVNKFVKVLQTYGFHKVKQDLTHDLFCFFEAIKKDDLAQKINQLPEVSLQPCLYKKR